MLILPLLVLLFALLGWSLWAVARHLIHGPRPTYRKQAALAARPQYNLRQWRDAAREGPVLEHAVEEMGYHTSMVHQLTNAWLDAVNQHALDAPRFQANVAEAARLADVLEPDCADVVDELRQIEAQRLRHSELLERRLQANAMKDWAQRHEQTLRAELAARNASTGISIDVLTQRGNGVATLVSREQVEARLPLFTANHVPELRSVLI